MATLSRPPISDSESPPHLRFVLVAGEASGDLLGESLIRSLRTLFPQASFAGIGGPLMVAAGLDAWYPAESLAVMGLVEVIKHLPRLLAIRRDIARRCLAQPPAAFIGIDAPDFNLGLERKLKRARIPTVHYVSPSIWAWREKRATKMGHSADRVLCLFPMEPPIYARHGVDARFVGHPLADTFALEPDRAAARSTLGLAADAPVLALLPGSRLGEIDRLGRDFLGAAKRLQRQLPRLQIVAPMANQACRDAFATLARAAGFLLADQADVANASRTEPQLVMPDAAEIAAQGVPLSHVAMIAADAVLLASGTAALEAMLAKRPMVVAYRLAPLSYRIIKGLGLLKVERYSLPNVLAGGDLVPELMQDACTPEALADALQPALEGKIDTAMLARYHELHRMLRQDASRSAAAAIADLLARTPRADLR